MKARSSSPLSSCASAWAPSRKRKKTRSIFGATLEVGVVRFDFDVLGGFEPDELERARADRLGRCEFARLDGLGGGAGEDVLRNDRVLHVRELPQELGVRGGERQPDRVRIEHFDPGRCVRGALDVGRAGDRHPAGGRDVGGGVLRIPGEGERHVVGRERRSVMPLRVLREVERVDARVIGRFPRLCEVRDQRLGVRVHLDQHVVDQAEHVILVAAVALTGVEPVDPVVDPGHRQHGWRSGRAVAAALGAALEAGVAGVDGAGVAVPLEHAPTISPTVSRIPNALRMSTLFDLARLPTDRAMMSPRVPARQAVWRVTISPVRYIISRGGPQTAILPGHVGR